MALSINVETQKITCQCGNVMKYSLPVLHNYFTPSSITTTIPCPACEGSVVINAQLIAPEVNISYNSPN